MLNQGNLREAHKMCLSILSLDSNHADAHFLLGMIAFNLQQMTKAIGLIDVAIKRSPSNAEYLAFQARCLSLVNRYKEAYATADAAQKLGSNSALVHDTLGVVYSRLGEHEKAIRLFKLAIELQPRNPNYFYNIAASYKFIGDFDSAETAYEKVIELKPDYYQAHSALAELLRATKDKNNIDRLLKLNIKAKTNPNAHLHICHALSKEYECIDEYDKAIDILKEGNSAKKSQLGYKIENDMQLFSELKRCFNKSTLSQIPQAETLNEPIFVIGMPRSGTTLVDRILSSHSYVMSAGELQNFGVEIKKMTQTKSSNVLDLETIRASMSLNFDQLGKRYIESTLPQTAGFKHFIDKMPLNFFYIGHIKKALPNAKIVVLRRNPMDTCLSNFRTLFAVNFSYYNYSYDLSDTAEYYALFDDIIQHWVDIFGDDILQINYEDLVVRPEKNVRNLLSHCGLEWEDQCLDFHQNKAPVSTASAVQVREPLNSKSVGRWTRYGDGLDELKSSLRLHGLI